MKNDFLNELENIEVPMPEDFQEKIKNYARQIAAYNEAKNIGWYDTPIFKKLVLWIKAEISETPAIKLLEDMVKFFKMEKQKILIDELPTLMQAAGLYEAVTEDGIKIKLRREVNCKQLNKIALAKWLIDHDYGDFIKDKLELGKGEFDESLKMFLDVNGYSYKKDTGIHYQTLAKIIRDRIDAGETLPQDDVLHVDIINIAKIKED